MNLNNDQFWLLVLCGGKSEKYINILLIHYSQNATLKPFTQSARHNTCLSPASEKFEYSLLEQIIQSAALFAGLVIPD